MELFKTLICNFIYFNRHTKLGSADMPVFTSLINLSNCFFFIINMLVTLADIFIYVGKVLYLMPLWCLIVLMYAVAGSISLFLYCKTLKGTRYISTLKNPKYYKKSRKILSVCFVIGSYASLFINAWLLWARNNGLI